MAWNEQVLKLLGDASGRVAGTRAGMIFTAGRIVTGVAAGANLDSVFITGAKPVVFYARNVDRSGSSVSAQIFETPTYTGGTAAPIYNTNKILNTATSISILADVTVTATGAQALATSYAVGNTTNGGQGGQAVLGEILYMKPNTTYLLRITNLDTQASTIAAMLAWAEGGL